MHRLAVVSTQALVDIDTARGRFGTWSLDEISQRAVRSPSVGEGAVGRHHIAGVPCGMPAKIVKRKQHVDQVSQRISTASSSVGEEAVGIHHVSYAGHLRTM